MYKKQILTIAYMLVTSLIFGQGIDYIRGFRTGFNEGFCYSHHGCIPPLPPLTPFPLLYENGNSYQDGYKRGFTRGLSDRNQKEDKSSEEKLINSLNSNQSYYNPQKSNSSISPIQILPNAKMELDDNIFNAQLQMQNRLFETQMNLLLGEIESKKEKALNFLPQVKKYYDSFSSYPTSIRDGWHNVISTNNYDFCEERKVYVTDNKVTKYLVGSEARLISLSTIINNAKSIIRLVDDNDILDIYFLESLK